MTVAELITELQKLPQDLDVAFKTTVTVDVNQDISSVVVGGADYGLEVVIT